MQDVIQETVRLFDEVYSVFGLSYTIELSTMPEDHIGTVEEWERNQDILKNAITAMGVVLVEAAHPEQAVEGAGHLVPVDQTQLGHAEGEVPVGVGLILIHQHAAGAVHGLDGEVHIVNDGGVHIVFIVVPVAGALPQLTVEHDGGGDLHIAVLLVDLTPVVQQGVLQGHALGQEEGEAGALVPEHEQAQLLAQLPVVPLLGLFDLGQIGVQLVLLGEGDAVDAL